MTVLLEKAIEAAKKSPPDMQDTIAQLILDELRDEEAWQEEFDSTEDVVWDRLAAEVREEIRKGDTEPLDSIL